MKQYDEHNDLDPNQTLLICKIQNRPGLAIDILEWMASIGTLEGIPGASHSEAVESSKSDSLPDDPAELIELMNEYVAHGNYEQARAVHDRIEILSEHRLWLIEHDPKIKAMATNAVANLVTSTGGIARPKRGRYARAVGGGGGHD